MNIPYIMKRCTICGEWKVVSTINFHKHQKCKYGLNSKCKECRNKYNKQYHKANRDKRLERQRQYYNDNKEMIAEQHKQYYEANRDKVSEQHKRYYEANKEKAAEQHKRYYEDNKEKMAEYHKQWYEANKEKELERCKRRYEANREKILEQKKQYRQSPKGQVVTFNSSQRRRIKEEQQGTGITKDQWLECMSFFDWKCAYSGETLSDKTRSIDHIVPLNSGGDNAIWNMVPMTRSLNSSKSTKDMEEWYRKQSFYDPKRLAKIYEWQEYAYNKYGKNTQYFNTNDIQIKLL